MTKGGKRGRKGMAQIYEEAISEFLDSNPRLKPKSGLELLKKRFPDECQSDAFPKDASIKSKISSMKQLRKKSRQARSDIDE